MKKRNIGKNWIVYLSTFPPRECGIATFTADLTAAIDKLHTPFLESKIVAVNPNNLIHYSYPKQVIFQISQSQLKDYIDVAHRLNEIKEVKMLNIQHEFGIFGGQYGSHVVEFIKLVRKPIVITLHTVLPSPNRKLRDTVRRLIENSNQVIVMTQSSKEILQKDYGADPKNLHVIPHGIHQVPYVESERPKAQLGFSGKFVLTTFGLLSKNKGIEYVLGALPEVVKRYPNVYYFIIGVTHPMVLRKEGEKYRNFLIEKVYKLGLTDQVRFFNKYLPLRQLLQFLRATDIYLAPFLNSNQTVSGTLSYALGAGRSVISTAFAQAKEFITPQFGILVSFRNSKALTQAIIQLLENGDLRKQMGRVAYFRTRNMTWSNVGISYVRVFAKYLPGLKEGGKTLPSVKLTHLARLTDDFGVIQFAKLTEPDPSSGYTVDDNARALLVAAIYYQKFRSNFALKLIETYLGFLEYTTQPNGYFANKVELDHKIKWEKNYENASARALYALGRVASLEGLPLRYRKRAWKLFDRSFQKRVNFHYPRAVAFYIKGLCSLLSKQKDKRKLTALREHCEKLISLYERHSSKDWQWFEISLTYSNAVLPEALISAYKITGKKKYLKIAEATLNFLIRKTFVKDFYLPIGQKGWYKKGARRERFDQQPEDVAATVEALKSIYSVTNDELYRKLMYKAFSWFLGDNILKQVVYDTNTGGCYDGIGRESVNLNQGAESTISFLLARFSFL